MMVRREASKSRGGGAHKCSRGRARNGGGGR